MVNAIGTGSRVAWGCTRDGATPTPPLVVPGGSEPDWGPADVPPARSTARPDGHGGGGTSAKLVVTVKRSTLRAALRKGLKLRVDVSSGGRLAAPAKRIGL